MTQNEMLLILFAVLIVAVAILFLTRAKAKDALPPQEGVAAPIAREGHGVGDEAAAAIEDVVDQFLSTDSHPALPEAAGPADELTRLKGLGPKAATQLNTLGITRYDQLAMLDEAQIGAIDAAMGAFKGRILKDQWVEQAKYLAADDRAGFEAKYGKLG